MVGYLQPLDEKFPIVGQDGKPTLYFIRWAQQKQIDLGEAVSAERALEIVEAYLADHPLQAGSGINILPDGKLSSNPTISAKVQEILDQLTTTQGSVLFRGTSGWEALPPGTNTQYLKSGGPAANPVWQTPSGGGGGSVSVEQNGVEVVSAASKLNFTGSVSVTDGGSGEAIINVTCGGGGGLPTIVQRKSIALANISQGITLDAPPTNGNILVAVLFNSTNAAPPPAATGWTMASSTTTVPDNSVLIRKAGPSETATQVPTNQADGGIIVMYEVTGTVAVSPEISVATANSSPVPFTSSAEYLPTSSGLMLAYSGRRTDEAGVFTGSTPTDIVIQGSAATTGGTGVSVTTGTGALVLNGSPSASCLWPTSVATKAGFILIA